MDCNMRSFRDATGKTWSINLTVAAVGRVRDMTQLDLMRPVDEKDGDKTTVFGLLTDDAVLFGRVLLQVLTERNVDADAFLESLSGSALGEAYDAFWSEYGDFFQGMKREHFSTAIQKQQLAWQLALQEAQTEAASIDPASVVSALRGSSSGAGPGSSESIPAS